MDYRQLGRSGLRVSPVCLGTMMFGDRTDEREAGEIVAHARDAGVNFIDTADVYANGASETITGAAIRADRTAGGRQRRRAAHRSCERAHPGAAAVAGLGRRALAALIDHAILFGIDVFVFFSTLRMTALTTDEWRSLPLLPFLAFLIFMKLAYFSAFTAMGGQTIGKMAARIRVVADDQLIMDPARAIKRTLTGVISLASLGLGLIPALIAPDRRALHDRVAHTHVVDLPSA